MATSSSTGGGQHHASLNLMACVRESSPQQEDLVSDAIDADLARHDPCNKKRRFHPFRGLRRIFRKKARHQHAGSAAASELQEHEAAQDHVMLDSGGTPIQALDAHRSRSTSTLLSGEDAGSRRRSGNGLFPCHSGLSVSHDSVFTAEHRTPHSSSEDLDTAQSSSSLSIQQLVLPGVRAELLDALRRRRVRGDCTSDDDEDLGLPHSPCNSPTTADVLLEQGLKENPTKSHSTCSDGSLLSMGSSEMDEDSLGQHSGHSSKLSLHDKKTFHDNDLELDLGVSAMPLSHSAARHKMAVRPKRTHGAPRRRRIQQLAGVSPLPSTPELNEEASGRSSSPDGKSSDEYSHSTRVTSMAGYHHHTKIVSESDIVSKALSKSGGNPERQKRVCGVVGEEDEEAREEDVNDDMLYRERERDDKKKDESSFFSRFIRRSGKKKKDHPQDAECTSSSTVYSSKQVSEVPPVVPKRIDLKGRYANETVNDYPVNVPPLQMKQHTGKMGGTRSTPASRQRVKPINIPASPEGPRKVETNREVEEVTVGLPVPSSPPPPATETEASKKSQETIPVNRMQLPYCTSPPKPTWPEPSIGFYSIKPSDSPLYAGNKTKSCLEVVSPSREGLEPTLIDNVWTHDQEDSVTDLQHFRSKLKLAGLSSYQQRLIANELNCDEREYTSLIDTVITEDSEENRKHAVKKSKSFRREPEVSALSNNLPAFIGESEASILNRSPQECSVKGETLWKYEIEQTKTVSSHKIIDNIVISDVSQLPLYEISTAEDCNMISGNKDKGDTTDPSSDLTGRHFTKNTIVTTRTIAKETSTTVENSPMASIYHSRQSDHIMKKSASLDSIGSLSESKKSPSPELHLSSKKSSSSESINSVTQQVMVPASSEGFRTIQNIKLEEESITVSNISTAESSAVPASQLTDKVSPLDVKKPVIFCVSSKTLLPESSTPAGDTTSKPLEPLSQSSAAISNQPVERVTNKVCFEKEQSQVTTPHRVQGSRARPVGPSSVEQIPEFLKVQLNRVDSKPATNVVLSTSVVFDNTDRSYNPQTRPKRKESLGKLTEKASSETAGAALNEVLITDTPATPSTQLPSVRDKKSSKEDVIVVYDSNMATEPATQSCSSGTVVQETGQKTMTACSDSSARVTDNDTMSAAPSPKQRSKSFPSTNQMNVTNIKCSVVSISSNMASSPLPSGSSKPVLKKQATSLDSADSHKSFMKKQMSDDFEDITIVDKAVIPNVEEVSSNVPNLEMSSSRKKSITKEHGSWREEEIIATEKNQEIGSVEVVLRSKKIISTKDFGLRKEEETNMVERRASGGVDTASKQDGKKFGLWREEEGQAEKRTSGGETIRTQENNLGTSEVVLRKKSISRGDSGKGGGGKDEEPELLKVFARRSLKLKDSESEALGQQVATKSRTEPVSEQQGTKSRDSDKENEGGDSPREERKKQMIKEPLGESKIHIDSSETIPVLKASTTSISLCNTPRIGSIVTGTNKYQRSLSSGATMNNEHTTHNCDASFIYRKDNPGNSPDKRQRHRTIPETPNTELSLEKTPHRVWANIYKEKEIDITNSETKRLNSDKINLQGENIPISGNSEESSMPRFKRIQQRKEEWELRAQQALKKTLP
ncbi:uncharacterized protein LOC111863422 isoform X3 [Cryptotermes secundus]|uniref:uncharacterized protein LOC111863422 isoform X3 n=1 Tax=Cryptotermes secundus TaxID=105785 RepID=UPI000CD7AB75|nr:uncharacterized protein LOC111863422 isoform X3 [Cryptotermes secundus]